MSQESQLPQQNKKRKAWKPHWWFKPLELIIVSKWLREKAFPYCTYITGGKVKRKKEKKNLNWATKSEHVLFSFCTSRSPACGVACSQTALQQLKHVTDLKWSKACVCDLKEEEKKSTRRSKDRVNHHIKKKKKKVKDVSLLLASTPLCLSVLLALGCSPEEFSGGLGKYNI